MLVLAALCLLGLFSTEIADTDFWWHLKTGEYIWQHRSLPVPDPFSYTADLGAPVFAGETRVRYFNLTHEWLGQLLWYAVYRLAGFPGVVLFKALLLTGFCGISGLLTARRTGSRYWGLAAAGAAASVAVLFSADRPALLTFLFVAVFVWILERGSPLWVLPVLALVWANCHGGFILGWVVLGAYAAGATISRRLGRPGPSPRRLWLITLVSMAVSGLNPSYFHIVEILAAYRRSSLQRGLVEWSQPFLWGPPYTFDILLYAAAAVLIAARRRVRMSDWLLFLLFAAASLLAFRNILFTAFLAPILIASYFPWQRRLPASAAPAVCLLLAALLGAGIFRGRFFQCRAALWKFPAGAAEFLLANHAGARLFNTYEYGGYLIWRLWPRQRVFIDGRALNESVYQDYVRALGDSRGDAREQVLARYGVEAIVANGFESTSGVIYPMVLALASPAEANWRLVYQDPAAMVFLRHPPAGMHGLPKSAIGEHLEAECGLYLDKDPELCLCARTLGLLFLRGGDAQRARRWLSRYLSSPHEPDPEAEAAYRGLSVRP